ncbi:magnesium transporter, partial [Morganella morganii]|uniref:magnesium transporter n=1 Tax=Morganella morganii TaxID=582 RepID=UPI0015F587FD
LEVAFPRGAGGMYRAWFLAVGPEVMWVVSLAMACMTVWTAVVSSCFPMVLMSLKVDPAVFSAPFIATLIDGTGLIIYFAMAKLSMNDLV